MSSYEQRSLGRAVWLSSWLAETIPEWQALLAKSLPDTKYEDLPRLSDDDEVQLWCCLDDSLSPAEEAVFIKKLKTSTALQAHLAFILRQEPQQTIVTTPSFSTREVPADFVILIARDHLRRGIRDQHRDLRSFSLARSGEAPPLTSIQDRKLTSVGTICITIDHSGDSTCQITFELENPAPSTEELLIELESERSSSVAPHSFREGFVIFDAIPPGDHEFVILQANTEIDRIVIRLMPDNTGVK